MSQRPRLGELLIDAGVIDEAQLAEALERQREQPRWIGKTLLDMQAVDEETLARTALVYMCTPSNPQGTVASSAYLDRLVELARVHDFVLVVDECYAEIYTRNAPPGTLQTCLARGGSLDRVLLFHSLSKRSSVPGLRSGFVVGDPDLIKIYLRLSEYGGNPSPLPVYAAATALWQEESHVEANRALYAAKFDDAERILSNRFGFFRPDGGFFLWLDVGDGETAARTLWTQAAIRVLPGAYLTAGENRPDSPGHRYIRVAMVHDRERTETALHRIVDTLQP